MERPEALKEYYTTHNEDVRLVTQHELNRATNADHFQIRELAKSDLPAALAVIHESFGTVADEFGLTLQNCPKHTAFLSLCYLETQTSWGWRMYCLFAGETVIGYMSLSNEGDGAYELHNLAVLPAYRHKGLGKRLLDHAKAVVDELGGKVIKVWFLYLTPSPACRIRRAGAPSPREPSWAASPPLHRAQARMSS